jgi:serine/threonine-protein kinase
MNPTATVLLAEDHAQTLRACSEALARAGLRVVAADSVPAAADLLARERPALAALDAALGGGDVGQLCRHLRRAGVPIFLLLPPRFAGAEWAALEGLADECVRKPFDAEDLARRAARRVATPQAPPAPVTYAPAGTDGVDGVADAVTGRESYAGREVAGCRLDHEIGRGASGVVYLARHATLDLPVAVKLMPAALVRWDAEERRRFLRGARAAARIQHPNVVPVLNAGEEGGCLFLVQRYVEGETLQARIDRLGALPEPAVRALLREIAGGLGVAHRLDIVHRDVKPANIILAASGESLLTDFGLARGGADREISSASAVVGTPLYMSPEQCSGKPLDGRSDLYSLGASAYHAAVGRPPISGDSPVAVLRNHLEQTPEPPHAVARGISRDLSATLMRLLAKDPQARFRDAAELLDALTPPGGGAARESRARPGTR